jgi:hypothetical protein
VQLKQTTLQPSLRDGSGTKFVNDLATEPYWALGRLFAAILLFLPLKLPVRHQPRLSVASSCICYPSGTSSPIFPLAHWQIPSIPTSDPHNMPKNTSKGTNVIYTNASAKRAKSSSTRPLTALNSTQHTKQLFGSKRKAVAPGASMQQPRSKKQRQQQQAQQLKQMPTSAKPNHPRCQPVSSACQQRHAAAATAAGNASAAAGADDAIAQASAVLVTPAFNIAAAGSKEPQDDEVRRLFRSWAWKREHRCEQVHSTAQHSTVRYSTLLFSFHQHTHTHTDMPKHAHARTRARTHTRTHACTQIVAW